MAPNENTAAVVRAYLSLWNATTEQDRRRAFADALTANARLVYPTFTGSGEDEILAALAAIQERWPGVRFVQSSGIEEHHDWLRVAWHMVDSSGTVVMTGVDVSNIAADGRLTQVVGFHDPLPALE